MESLELEFPLRVERYELRYGSGGDGAQRGGDGIERESLRARRRRPRCACSLTDGGTLRVGRAGGEPRARAV